MARVLCLSSQVIYGPVGNTAAVPALQGQGHEVMQVPTILLSHHPGHGRPVGQATPPDLLDDLLRSVARIGGLASVDAILTGYFASAEQVKVVSRWIEEINPPVTMVDPVMGDHGKLYVAEETAAAIRDYLLPLAAIAAPNLFELGWLTGSVISTRTAAIVAARKLGPTEVLVTSVPETLDTLATLLVTDAADHVSISLRLDAVPHGTGDYLAGLYLAQRLKNAAGPAFTAAMASLNTAIATSSGRPGLSVASATR